MNAPPPNDAALVQRVRTALGRRAGTHGTPRINVGSCSFVVTLHGTVRDVAERQAVEEIVREVPGVENRLGTRRSQAAADLFIRWRLPGITAFQVLILQARR